MKRDARDGAAEPLPPRLVISGTTGSGKTTLGRRLGTALGREYVELDSLYHEPGWTPAEVDVFRARVASRIAAPEWIVDGNYGPVRDLTWGSADLLIWLDFPLPLVMWRLFWRIMRRGLRREMLWNGNRESLRGHFLSRESLLLWALKTHAKHRREYPAHFAQYGARVVRMKSPRDLERWLRTHGIA